MRYVKQLLIILTISLLGEALHRLVPLLIPASVYGLVIMLLALKLKLLRLDQVQDTAEFLIGVMVFMLIPPSVGLIEYWGELKSILLPILLITCVTTLLVMGFAGRATQYLINRGKKGGK
jgi:holin-like protein